MIAVSENYIFVEVRSVSVTLDFISLIVASRASAYALAIFSENPLVGGRTHYPERKWPVSKFAGHFVRLI